MFQRNFGLRSSRQHLRNIASPSHNRRKRKASRKVGQKLRKMVSGYPACLTLEEQGSPVLFAVYTGTREAKAPFPHVRCDAVCVHSLLADSWAAEAIPCSSLQTSVTDGCEARLSILWEQQQKSHRSGGEVFNLNVGFSAQIESFETFRKGIKSRSIPMFYLGAVFLSGKWVAQAVHWTGREYGERVGLTWGFSSMNSGFTN